MVLGWSFVRRIVRVKLANIHPITRDTLFSEHFDGKQLFRCAFIRVLKEIKYLMAVNITKPNISLLSSVLKDMPTIMPK